MRGLVIGHGSIGQRHARLLGELGLDVAVVSRRAVDHPKPYCDLMAAMDSHQPDYIVIASATSEHYKDVSALAESGFRGRVLIEKPIFEPGQIVPNNHFASLHVGYNLRFHPVMRKLAKVLEPNRVLQIHAYVGQYLPDWRPGTAYQDSYSANLARGGGVLLDLSHDLDLLNGLVGPWRDLTALGGQLSDLEIDSDDVASILIRFAKCPAATLSLNYLDRSVRREIIVNCSDTTFKADLVAGTLETNGDVERFDVQRDTTYLAMHQASLSDGAGACTADEALEVLGMIAAVRPSYSDPRWAANIQKD